MGCKFRRAMRFSMLPSVISEKSKKQELTDAERTSLFRKMASEEPEEKQEEKNVVPPVFRHDKYISCRHCGRKSDDVFGTFDELNWFAVGDVTGGSYFPEPRTFYNLGAKIMYCSPVCWLLQRKSVVGVNFQQQFNWCMDRNMTNHCFKLMRLFDLQKDSVTATQAMHSMACKKEVNVLEVD